MDRILIFFPKIFFDLSERVFLATRSDLEETRRLVFSGKLAKSNELVVDQEEVTSGVVNVYQGRHNHNGKDVIGGIYYLEAYSLDNDEHCSRSIEELLEMKAEHIQKHGKSEPFPYEHLIQPHTFHIDLWVDAPTFESLRTVDSDRSKIVVGFELNPEAESTITQQMYDWLSTRIRVTTWDAKKEREVLAKSYSVSIESTAISEPASIPERAEVCVPPALHERLASLESELVERIRSAERTLLWCVLLLFGVFVAMLLKR